jgi:hypothetical protein
MESLKSPASEQLAGFTIGVTAARRSEELITLLERRGSNVVHAPAIRIIPLVDDIELQRVTTLDVGKVLRNRRGEFVEHGDNGDNGSCSPSH